MIMNYEESIQILKKIKGSKNILVNCHINPDPDSVGSALAMSCVLKKMGKRVEIISPGTIPVNLIFLDGAKEIKNIGFENLNFKTYDLVILLDSSSWPHATGIKNLPLPKAPIVVIDHHKTNTGFGNFNLIDQVSSTAEILYNLFGDWKVKITKKTATALLTGIIGDTGSFKYTNTTEKVLFVSSKLIDVGADNNEISLNLFNSYGEDELKLMGVLLKNIKVEKECFTWTSVPYEVYEKYKRPNEAQSEVAGSFIRGIKNTKFGMVIVERKKGFLDISFRSRIKGFDVSELAKEFGGGGHLMASGASFKIDDYNLAVRMVIKKAKRYAEKNLKTLKEGN